MRQEFNTLESFVRNNYISISIISLGHFSKLIHFKEFISTFPVNDKIDISPNYLPLLKHVNKDKTL